MFEYTRFVNADQRTHNVNNRFVYTVGNETVRTVREALQHMTVRNVLDARFDVRNEMSSVVSTSSGVLSSDVFSRIPVTEINFTIVFSTTLDPPNKKQNNF